MIRTAVTVSLVPEARGGPFVFWDDLPHACREASELGFDAIELFAPSPTAVSTADLESLLRTHQLSLAAVGTGAGVVKHRLSLTDPNPDRREAAKEFVKSMIQYGASFHAPAIIGSMQGRWGVQHGGAESRDQALDWLRSSLDELGRYAASLGVRLLYEPLNRYETNLITQVEQGSQLLRSLVTDNVRLLADLFHMNIEESNLAEALRSAGQDIGHIHFVDSNRHAAGRGHLDFSPIVAALRDIDYDGYLSAEAFPLPTPSSAAQATIKAMRSCLS